MCNSSISKPLSYIYNKSIQTGVFPNCLKYAIIKPLFKDGNRSGISNYRPISLLSAFSKILEKTMYSRLNQYLSINNILATEQYGLEKIGQQNMQLIHLLMAYFRLGIVNYKLLDSFVTSLRLLTV